MRAVKKIVINKWWINGAICVNMSTLANGIEVEMEVMH